MNGFTIARMGGDEFIVYSNEAISFERLQRIFILLEQEYCSFIEKNYPESHSSVSIGCVIGTNERSFQELYRIADEMMYDIKKHGKKGYKMINLD